ncbi:unnamed protein product [Allacma fusca]|uniref:Uncharacterized protein n=1 Tax=Allacma fusca TaxID=39272 RepID=A0A8J2JTD4_9HEXA|nr:unnamed protein product [Allacma fusca]
MEIHHVINSINYDFRCVSRESRRIGNPLYGIMLSSVSVFQYTYGDSGLQRPTPLFLPDDRVSLLVPADVLT